MKTFLKKNLIGLIAMALLLACGGVVYGAVGSQEPDRGDNPLMYESTDNKQVFPEGKGYSLSKEKAKEYQLPEKNQEQQNVITGSASNSFDYSLGGFSFKSGGRGNYSFNSRAVNYSPSLSVLIGKKFMKDNVAMVEGETLAFDVKAVLYGNAKISEDNITVKYGDKTLTCKDSDSSTFGYEIKVIKGEKTLSVTVTDSARAKASGKKCETTKTYTVTGTENKPVSIEVIMSSFFDDYSLSNDIDVDAGKTKQLDTVLRNTLKKGGFTISIDSDDNIAVSGEAFEPTEEYALTLTEDTVKKLTDMGYEDGIDFVSQLDPQAGGTVGRGTFVINTDDLDSCWRVYVNGKKKSLDYEVSSGDEVELVFEIFEK